MIDKWGASGACICISNTTCKKHLRTIQLPGSSGSNFAPYLIPQLITKKVFLNSKPL